MCARTRISLSLSFRYIPTTFRAEWPILYFDASHFYCVFSRNNIDMRCWPVWLKRHIASSFDFVCEKIAKRISVCRVTYNSEATFPVPAVHPIVDRNMQDAEEKIASDDSIRTKLYASFKDQLFCDVVLIAEEDGTRYVRFRCSS